MRIVGVHFLCAALFACATSARADIGSFYVARDRQETLASGAFAGEPNPNVGRLTFLYAHSYPETPANNHFHGIGVHSYTGDLGAHDVVTTNANNRIPETYTLQAPLTLTEGTGVYADKLVSASGSEHYSDLSVQSILALSGFDPTSPESIMYNSSGGRYQGVLDGALIAWELVDISPGLHVGSASDLSILDGPNATFTLGVGDALDFTPVFWTDANAAPGKYSATLRLVDVGADPTHVRVADSGTLHFDFAVVPEPGAFALLAGSALLVYPWVRRKVRT
jgi:hypothetical protein